MNQNDIYTRLETVFKDVFDDNSITLTSGTSAEDIEEWDSMKHIQIINAVEQEFKMKFTMKQISLMKNIGEMVEIIMITGK